MFVRIAKEERGIALVTAVLVSMVVLILGTAVIQLSIHNTERSGEDRRRVQAIGAAEAGIDYYFSYLTETGGQAIPCRITRNMLGSAGSFTVTAFFEDKNGVPISCPLNGTLDQSVTPAVVTLYSDGKSAAAAPIRRMQARANLTVSKGGTFDNSGVIFAQNNVTFTSNARLGGSQFSDADIYSNGNFTLAANSTIFGKVSAQGTVSLGSNSEVKKDVWAKGNITFTTRASVGRGSTAGTGVSVTSSQGSITLGNASRIYGDARAKGTITGGTVDGSRSAGQNGLPDPPTRSYPAFTYNQTEWSNAGYAIAPTFSGATACTDAVNYIKNTWTNGDLVVRIAAPCTTTFAINTKYNVYGNFAIIADGPITLSTNTRFVRNPSTGDPFNVFVFGGLSGVPPCNFTANANSGFNAGLVTLLYVPGTCTVDLLSNS